MTVPSAREPPPDPPVTRPGRAPPSPWSRSYIRPPGNVQPPRLCRHGTRTRRHVGVPPRPGPPSSAPPRSVAREAEPELAPYQGQRHHLDTGGGLRRWRVVRRTPPAAPSEAVLRTDLR